VILVDTNILIDIASGDENWAEWSINALADAMSRGPLAINAIIYSEFSLGFSTEAACDAEIARFHLLFLDLPRAAGFRAGRAFRDYRRRGGARSSALPHFFIGAQASVLGVPILTRDLGRYRTYFPEVELVAP
jgi:predicted nucleic acid-binding protein